MILCWLLLELVWEWTQDFPLLEDRRGFGRCILSLKILRWIGKSVRQMNSLIQILNDIGSSTAIVTIFKKRQILTKVMLNSNSSQSSNLKILFTQAMWMAISSNQNLRMLPNAMGILTTCNVINATRSLKLKRTSNLNLMRKMGRWESCLIVIASWKKWWDRMLWCLMTGSFLVTGPMNRF